jgi:hypothetical protein
VYRIPGPAVVVTPDRATTKKNMGEEIKTSEDSFRILDGLFIIMAVDVEDKLR